ncbi:uncharacterized protein V1510DRAFT_314260 [Dipodascopsis tothii]|uniref:uncharacterized protein n=1 Tax=Dipodascopsis tothii TaxID=44089 RepID=UPI0034CE5185
MRLVAVAAVQWGARLVRLARSRRAAAFPGQRLPGQRTLPGSSASTADNDACDRHRRRRRQTPTQTTTNDMATDNKLFRFPDIFQLPSSENVRAAGVYTAGGLFALGFWFFLDSAIYSHTVNTSEVHVRFVDWLPALCSVMGIIVINSIDKSRLNNDASFSFSGSGVAWKARLVLFMGFALLAGGFAGSIVVLIIKYLIPDYPLSTLYFGISNVVANGLLMLSCIVLWVSQNVEDEYSYSLAL